MKNSQVLDDKVWKKLARLKNFHKKNLFVLGKQKDNKMKNRLLKILKIQS
jgi:phosphotransferase system IIB component